MTFATTAHTVKVADAPGGAWAVNADLECRLLRRGLAPTIDSAELLFRYGTIDGSYVSPISIGGKFVRIEIPDVSVDWVGYVVGENKTRGMEETVSSAQRVTLGDQVFQVVGLEWFLGRNIISDDSANGSGGPETVQRAIGFNTGAGDTRSVETSFADNKSTSGLLFELGASGREAWSIRDALRYLVSFHGPVDKDGNQEPVSYEIDIDDPDMVTYLDSQPAPPTRTENRSTLQIINALLSPTRGLAWHLQWDAAGNEGQIKVHSQAVSDTSLPGSLTLPANFSKAALDVDGLTGVTDCKIQTDLTRRYDKVVVRGARRRSVFTVGIEAGTLEKSWAAAQETEYIAGASGDAGYAGWSDDKKKRANDRVREKAELERVYQAYRIPDTWGGLSNDGSSAGDFEYACPEMQLGTTTIDDGEPLNLPGFRLLPTLPLYVGWDYSDAASPVDNSGGQRVLQRPFAVVDAGDGSTEWRFADRVNTTNEELAAGGTTTHKTSYHMLAVDGEPGFQLRAGSGSAHAIADGHYDPTTDPPSQHNPEISYSTLRATVCGEWDSYCEAFTPALDAASDPLQVLFIDVGERARLDYLAENTIWDVREGVLQTVSTGGVLRDDRNLCWQLAWLAKTWYDDARSLVSIRSGQIISPATLGSMITDVGTGASAETVNAVVSQINYQLESNRTEIVAGFSDLDFSSVI